MTHYEYCKKKGKHQGSGGCTPHHLTFGGKCLNCGYDPKKFGIDQWGRKLADKKNPSGFPEGREGTHGAAYGSSSRGLPGFRVHLADGTSYDTSMAKGVTLGHAKKYFLGQYIERQEGKPAVRVTRVSQLSNNPRKRGITRRLARAALRARRHSKTLKSRLRRRLGHGIRSVRRHSKIGWVRRAALSPKRRKKVRR